MQKKDPTKIVFSYLIVHKGQQYIIDTHKNNVVGMYLLHLSNASREKLFKIRFPLLFSVPGQSILIKKFGYLHGDF